MIALCLPPASPGQEAFYISGRMRVRKPVEANREIEYVNSGNEGLALLIGEPHDRNNLTIKFSGKKYKYGFIPHLRVGIGSGLFIVF